MPAAARSERARRRRTSFWVAPRFGTELTLRRMNRWYCATLQNHRTPPPQQLVTRTAADSTDRKYSVKSTVRRIGRVDTRVGGAPTAAAAH
jgi:hypothetical protein